MALLLPPSSQAIEPAQAVLARKSPHPSESSDRPAREHAELRGTSTLARWLHAQHTLSLAQSPFDIGTPEVTGMAVLVLSLCVKPRLDRWGTARAAVHKTG